MNDMILVLFETITCQATSYKLNVSKSKCLCCPNILSLDDLKCEIVLSDNLNI